MFMTQRDMGDKYTIQNKLGSTCLWVSNTKELFPALLKVICTTYEKRIRLLENGPSEGIVSNCFPLHARYDLGY